MPSTSHTTRIIFAQKHFGLVGTIEKGLLPSEDYALQSLRYEHAEAPCQAFPRVFDFIRGRPWMETKFTHFDSFGNAIMIDISEKAVSNRMAKARGEIRVSKAILDAVRAGNVAKGDVLGIARVAGIMAAKRTAELIPLCHILALSHVGIDFSILDYKSSIEAACTVKLQGNTGAEMEALVGVSTALLTIYDMCKAIDHSMKISGIYLLHKEGGKSGVYDCD